jgi:N-acetylglutamate synthase-like GNAT family acetyltransferase
MSAPNLRVRRATVEDLDTLRPLWTSMRLSAAELEPRLTEFQVVEDSPGHVVGGIGFQIGERHGLLHSEGFTDFAIADRARELLWNRLQTLATNHGIFRLWSHECTPFWVQTGFKPANADDLKKLPAKWNAESSPWFTLQLKDEEAIASFEKELTMYMAAEKQQSARMLQKGRSLKTLLTLLALILAFIALGALAYLLVTRPDVLHPGR